MRRVEEFANPAEPGGLEYVMDQPRPDTKNASTPTTDPVLPGSRSSNTSGRVGRRAAPTPADITHTRELFWNNVIREILSTLATASAMGSPPPGEPGVDRPQHPSDVLDGRLAIITREGARIPIAAVMPLFACGVPGTDADRVLSMDVECTVFQIRTPTGEVFTLPLHEIRSFHALTDELMERLRAAARAQSKDDDQSTNEPFGFAAFTSLARARKESLPVEVEPHFTGPHFDPVTRAKPPGGV